MIWIASFPGSGSDILFKILQDIYGESTLEYNQRIKTLANKSLDQFQFVSTHLPPYSLPKELNHFPSIYIVRDGRDAICSMIQSEKTEGLSDAQKMAQAIVADQGSTYGGWSINVAQWAQKSNLVIRYEDLLVDPIKELEKIRTICPNLPVADAKKVKAMIESKSYLSEIEERSKSSLWQKSMSSDLHEMFWGLHGDTMNLLGYKKDGSFISGSEYAKLTLFPEKPLTQNKRILVEATTLLNPQVDGTMRYIHMLLRAIHAELLKSNTGLDIRAKLDTIKTLDSMFLKAKKVAKKERKNIFNRFITYVIGFPRRLKKSLPNKLVQTILFITHYSGLLSVYRSILQIFNRKIVKKYEKDKLDLLHLTLPQRQIAEDISLKITCTIHDLTCKLFPQFHARHSVKGTHRNIKTLEKAQVDLIAVSEHTKKDILEHYSFDDKRIDVIYEAIDHELFHPIFDEEKGNKTLAKYNLVGVPYFFSLCTLEPRKNLKSTLEAFIIFCEKHPDSPIRFVMSGAYGWKLGKLPKHEKILYTGYLPDNELATLYAASIGACYVSFYEGFGLPPLEAMRCKTVPIYGRNSSMLELIGDYGFGADPHDPNDIAAQMEKLAFNPEMRKEMEEKCYVKSWDFTLSKLGQNTINHYLKLLST